MVDAQYFGDGLTNLNPSDLKGKLIAIEGTDGVGRSTHIEMLQEWLEVQGYGVVTTGWTRSNLMSKTIEMAKEGNILDRWSFSLLYATDFADRLEHEIIPALRSGFIVLADRYIYTAFARDFVRSANRQWVRDVFGFALSTRSRVLYAYRHRNTRPARHRNQRDELLGIRNGSSSGERSLR